MLPATSHWHYTGFSPNELRELALPALRRLHRPATTEVEPRPTLAPFLLLRLLPSQQSTACPPPPPPNLTLTSAMLPPMQGSETLEQRRAARGSHDVSQAASSQPPAKKKRRSPVGFRPDRPSRRSLSMLVITADAS